VTPRYLIDKSAWARLEVPSVARVLEPLIQDDEIVVCPAFTLEVLYSARNLADYSRIRQALAGFPQVSHASDDWRLAELLQ
jgi:predicted nucleic acid-binding protein